MWAHLRATGHVRNSELADLDMHDAPSALYQKGALALKQASYEEAIACLEQFCKETVDRQSKPFFSGSDVVDSGVSQRPQGPARDRPL